MLVVCTDSDRRELMEVLIEEKVMHQVAKPRSVREEGTGSYELFTIQANLPEVTVPPEFRQSEGDVRAFRLPSGRLIITDLEGNLEQIASPMPRPA